MANRKKKKEIPVTGILAAVVIILLLCAGIVIWLWAGHSETGGQSGGSRPEQTEASGTVTVTEAETAEDDTGESGMTKESEMQTQPETAGTVQTESGETAELTSEQSSESASGQESEPQEKLVVAIDPGHQGSWVDMSDQEPSGPGSSEMKAKASTGTQSSFSDKKEYELNLEISLLLRDELEERGYEVVLTREDHDTAISNAERAQLAYEQGGDIYVRIHANGSDDPSVSGALAMVPSSDNPYVGYLAEDSYLLGQCILDAYCSKASFESLGVQYYDNMTGINWSQIPVMILEMGFMTNQSDDSRMSDPSVQLLMAEGIADGIDRYFTEKGMKEETVTEEAAAKMNALVEQVGEDYLYPSMESGEEWAFSVKNLTTGAQGSIEGDRQMKSASVIKLFIMAAIYDRVCYPASEERHITFEESYDGELKQLITDMITVSDNEAANTLIERLGGGDAQTGMQVVNQFCQENGYTATVLGRRFLEENPAGDNYTSANDCLRLLESIYSGTCVNAEASAKMYEYLVNQTRRNKIPAGLEGTTALSANKTGELAGEYGDQVENDAAVVETDGSVYVLCILSQNLADHAAAIEQIAQISGTVYELI